MRQIVIPKYGGVNVFRIEEKPDPQPGKDEVLIRVKASGINFADILARQGLYPDAPKRPMVVGYEVSGVVESVGEDTDENLKGKEVLATTRFHGYSDAVVVRAAQIFDKPKSLSFEQAAAIPVNYLTAYQLLITMGALKKEESVLIHNAGGGVGLAALDIAKKIGATTYGTASSGKHDFLKQRGLDYAIDYRTENWLQKLKVLTDGKGVELVLDPLGGTSWKKSYQALRATGRLGMFGISTATESGLGAKLSLLKVALQMPWFNPVGLMNTNKSVFGVNLGRMWGEAEKAGRWMQEILDGVEEGWVQPHVDKTFFFEKVGEAHAYIEARKNIGKVILVP
ncbi:zinc-binding dehydrogenase [candidate division KSB1 bacterium]|nr:zinc-binding dehydrogenase [candidate division KSB1 bacterium]